MNPRLAIDGIVRRAGLLSSVLGRPRSAVPAAVVAVACSACGVVTRGSPGSGGDGGGGTAGTDAGTSAATAAICGEYFDTVGVPCGGVSPLLPEAELLRARGRYQTLCAARLGLPGSGFTTTSVAACASAVGSLGCSATLMAVCSFTEGTLPAGAPCTEYSQCAGGICKLPYPPMGFGNPPPSRRFFGHDLLASNMDVCGACAPLHAPGEVCLGPEEGVTVGILPGLDGLLRAEPCSGDSVCDFASTGVCIPRQQGGEPCTPGVNPPDSLRPRGAPFLGGACAEGLYCNGGTCARAGQLGESAPCAMASTLQPVCVPPLLCDSDTCVPPHPAGAPCADDGDCESGLGCETRVSVTVECGGSANSPGTCEGLGCVDATSGATRDCACTTPTFSEPGEPCGGAARCLMGSCNITTRRCSEFATAIPDGAPCIVGDSACDWFASCIDGRCTLGYPSCRG